jgi:hypothetical protein
MNEPIDKLLRDWSRRQQPDAAAERRLTSRILQAAADDTRRTTSPHRESPQGHHRALWFAAGVAATLIAAAVWHALVPAADPLSALLRQEHARFTDRRRTVSRVFRETERLFGSNLQWIAESGDQTELGVADETAVGEPLIVRVVLVSRPVGTDTWQPLWTADVVARANGLLQLAPDGAPGNRLALWLHRLDGCAALVESRLDLRTPVPLATEASEVLRFGATRTVTRLCQNGVEYLLLQTVAPLTERPPCNS